MEHKRKAPPERDGALVARVEPLPPAPLPRLHELASPDTTPRRSRIGFLVNVVERVAAIGQGQALLHHPSAHVLAGYGALADDALVAVAAQVLARHGPAGDLVGKRVGRVFTALPRLAVQAAELPVLRRADPAAKPLASKPKNPH